jgi:hypothetical protein
LLVVLLPAVLVGAWRHRRDPAFTPWLIYTPTLILFAAVVSAVHVPYGTFIHSAVALLPHAYLLALLGLAVIVHWVAARRPSWDASRATRVFSAMLVGVCLFVSGMSTVMALQDWQHERDSRLAILDALEAYAEPGDVVMSPDAGAYRYYGGWPGIVTPEDPLPVVEDALRRYGVRWLALERAHMVRSLAPVLAGEVDPVWLSEPLVVTPPPADLDLDADSDPMPGAALYAVCLTPDDARCQA